MKCWPQNQLTVFFFQQSQKKKKKKKEKKKNRKKRKSDFPFQRPKLLANSFAGVYYDETIHQL